MKQEFKFIKDFKLNKSLTLTIDDLTILESSGDEYTSNVKGIEFILSYDEETGKKLINKNYNSKIGVDIFISNLADETFYITSSEIRAIENVVVNYWLDNCDIISITIIRVNDEKVIFDNKEAIDNIMLKLSMFFGTILEK